MTGLRDLLLLLALLLAAPVSAQDWPREFYDPAPEAADLVLPMPCGAAMAFQKVTVPVDASDPLADRQVRLGQTQDATGYSDYLRPAYLRGPFVDEDAGTTHYYIARYELTAGQYRALQGDCDAPSRRDRLAQGGLSWFDALDLARSYSEWLLRTRPDTLPMADGAPAYARLPTGAEWEFATRGGARIEATQFPARRFFAVGELREFALHQAPGSGRGRLSPVGLRKANPLGLYDVYGNAEEWVLEPFRLNALGRDGGQVGGVVTRGGSVLSTPDAIYSAQRTEYPPYDAASGAPLRLPSFGLRLVLATQVATSDARLGAIRARWSAQASAPAPEGEDPLALLTRLIDAEIDPRRQEALNDLKLAYRRAADAAQTALRQSARATLLAGAVFVESLVDNHAAIEAKAANIRMLVDLQNSGSRSQIHARQLQRHVSEINGLRARQSTILLSYRATLESLLSDMESDIHDAAYEVLREELALSGERRVLSMLDRLWRDLGLYAGAPDLGREALLRMALE